MNMLLGMLKNLLPDEGDYRVKWTHVPEVSAPLDFDITVIEIRDASDTTVAEVHILRPKKK